MNKYELTSYWNKEARKEIEVAGRPRWENPEGHRFHGGPLYDPEAVWGFTVEEIESAQAAAKKLMRSWKPSVRREARETYWRWECRKSAAHGLSVRWF